MSNLRRPWKIAAILCMPAVLGGCSSFGGGPNYQASKQTHSLEMPPGLTMHPGSEASRIPEIAPRQATFSSYQQGAQGSATAPTASVDQALSTPMSGVHMKRDGAVQWLVVDAKPAALWPRLKDFFEQQGFKIALSEPALGIMETNWQGEKAEKGDGFFSRLLNKVNSTGLRDKYRVRLEPAQDPNKTLVFITQRGLKEVAFSQAGGEFVRTAWETRPSDPELEAEMTERLLVYLGATKEQAKKVMAEAGPDVSRAHLKQDNGHVSLDVSEVFARTWRRTGLALDRLGVTISDEDRSGGLYYIRLPADFFKKKDKGWLANLFGSDKQKKLPEQYQLHIADQGASCTIRVLTKDGKADDTPVARHILTRLQTYLK